MLLVFTGNGKGKTTAALGQAMRVLGRGKRALVVQFIKGPWKAGEDYFSSNFQIPSNKFQIRKMGLGFVGILGDTLPKEAHTRAAWEALQFAKSEMDDGKWDLIVLDEVNVAISLGLLTAADVLAVVRQSPVDKLILCTGRNAPVELIEAADLVTEMREVKHPYQSGKQAKIAVEF